ncbi:hypothetical protein ACVWWN_003142 [Mycobacterium sp. URHB0021]
MNTTSWRRHAGRGVLTADVSTDLNNALGALARRAQKAARYTPATGSWPLRGTRQSGIAAPSGTTTANRSATAARLAVCMAAAGTAVPSTPGSARVAVAAATTVGA